MTKCSCVTQVDLYLTVLIAFLCLQDEGGGESAGVTAFNMNDENDEGHFDDDGNFVWNKEDTRVQEEAWLDGVSQEQIGAALHAKVGDV